MDEEKQKGIIKTEPVANVEFAKDVFKLVSGNVLVQMLSMGLAPILSRIFLPEYFGVTAVFSSLYTTLSVFTCLRYEVTIVLTKTKEEAANMLAISIMFAFLTLGILLPVLWFTRSWFADILKTPLLAEYMWVIPIVAFLIGIFNALNYWNSRRRKYSRLSAALVMQEFVQDGIRLGFGFAGHPSGLILILSNMAGYVTSFGELVRRFIKEDRGLFKTLNWAQIRTDIARYRKFPLFNIWAGLINNFSNQVPMLMLAAFFSTTITGYYSLGYGMVRLPIIMIAGAIGQVFLQRAGKARYDGSLPALVESTYDRLLTLGLFPMLLITMAGKDIFIVMLGNQWAEAGVYSQILSLWTFFVFVSMPLNTLANVFERQEINLVLNIVVFVSRIISLLIGGLLHNVLLTMWLFALSGILTSGWYILWALRTAGVSIPRSILKFFNNILFCLPFLLIVAAGIWIIQMRSSAIFILSGVVAIFYYIMVVVRDPVLLGLLLQIRIKRINIFRRK